MRPHPGVNLGEIGLTDELDDEHWFGICLG